jgi:predicted adenylyl cyclase CyaB
LARNIEIKARVRDVEKQMLLAERLADEEIQHLYQEDTYFLVSKGRLKLRVFGDGSGELIQYDKDYSIAPTESCYLRLPVDCPSALKSALTRSLGVRAVVRKKRIVYHVGQTRIHFDEIEDLGTFIELEYVLGAGDQPDHGASVVTALMQELEIDSTDLIKSAYVGLVESRGRSQV